MNQQNRFSISKNIENLNKNNNQVYQNQLFLQYSKSYNY